MLYALFCVIPRHLNFIYPRFGTLCLFHFYRRLGMKMEQTERSETSAYKIQTPGNYPEESIQHSEQDEIFKSGITEFARRLRKTMRNFRKSPYRDWYEPHCTPEMIFSVQKLSSDTWLNFNCWSNKFVMWLINSQSIKLKKPKIFTVVSAWKLRQITIFSTFLWDPVEWTPT